MRGLDEKLKIKILLVNNYKEGVKNINIVFLSILDLFLKYKF